MHSDKDLFVNMKFFLGILVFSLLWCNVGFAKFAVLECMQEIEAEAEINPKIFVEINADKDTIFFLIPDIGYSDYFTKPNFSNPNEFLRRRKKLKPIGILYNISKIDNMNIYAAADKASLILDRNTLKFTIVLKLDEYEDTITYECRNLNQQISKYED